MMSETFRILPKRMEDMLFGSLDQRLEHLDSLFDMGMIDQEFRDKALEDADAAFNHLTFINAESLTYGRHVVDEAINTFTAAIELFDNALADVFQASRAVNHVGARGTHG